MSNQREEFEKWVDEYGSRCDDRDDAYRLWSAAISASDARYQARVRELEYALEAASCVFHSPETQQQINEALSTTTPDTALQKALLEARIDESQQSHGASDNWMEGRQKFLAKQLAALGE